MRALIGIALVILTLVILTFLGHASAQVGSAAAGSITGDVSTKGTQGELAAIT